MQIYADTDTDADTHIATGADIDTDTDTDTRYWILDTGCCAMIALCC